MHETVRNIVFSEKDKYSFRPEVQIIGFGLLICLAAWIIGDAKLFGHKSVAIFDIWTFTHVAAGAVLSFVAILMRHIDLHHPIMLLLIMVLGWEVVEHYLEISQLQYVSSWFAGEETIMNRLVADQIAAVAGFLLIKWRPQLLPFFLVIAGGILGLHLCLGSSMYFFN